MEDVMVVCPHCNFVMDPLDDECSKCFGKGRVAPDTSSPVAAIPAPTRARRQSIERKYSLRRLLVASLVMFLLGFVASRYHYRNRIREIYSNFVLQPKGKPKPVVASAAKTTVLAPLASSTHTLTYVVAAVPQSSAKEATISYKDPGGKIARAPGEPPLPLPWSMTYGMSNGTMAWLMASGVKGNVHVEIWQDGKLMDSAATTEGRGSVDCSVKVGQTVKTRSE